MRPVVSLLLTLSVLLSTVSGAAAAVTFDPATGTGSVGKADLQAAFGWTEKTFQANARKLTFHAVHHVAWTWQCQIDGEAVTLLADEESSRSVSASAITTGVRKGRTIIGFELTGYAGPGPDVPLSPASCPSGEPTEVTVAVSDVLYADLRNRSESIWSG
jgi:hypothetical protein